MAPLLSYKHNMNIGSSKDCETNHFGLGILKSTSKKTSKQMEIAASIISLVYQVKIQVTNLYMTMRE